ncbi:MAG: GH25 family lysozyme [Solimonas sp.]
MDIAAAARDGIQFLTHKATEATWTRHVHFGEAMRRARDAGIPILGAYHVVRSPANAAAEVDYCLAYVDAQTPWWRDWPHWFWQVDLEKWPYDSVAASEGEQFADIIEARTGRKAVIYASRGQYGEQLTGTSHELWNANYGSNIEDHYTAVYAARGGDSGPGWVTYSGRMPIFWQFGSRTRIGSQPICDANAFRGTLTQLRTLISPIGDDMPLSDDDAQALIWRVEALINNRAEVVGGPLKGERNMVAARLAELPTATVDVAALAEALTPLLPAPATAAEIAKAVLDEDHARSAE